MKDELKFLVMGCVESVDYCAVRDKWRCFVCNMQGWAGRYLYPGVCDTFRPQTLPLFAPVLKM